MDAVETGGAEARAISRRRFIKALLGFSVLSTLAMIVTPVVGFLLPAGRPSTGSTGRLLVGKVADLVPGQGRIVALGSKPVIVCNSPQGLTAFSAVCTHLGCIVGYDTSQSPDIVSPCHDGHFSVMNGTVISGPPPAPLKAYRVAVEQDQVYVQDA